MGSCEYKGLTFNVVTAVLVSYAAEELCVTSDHDPKETTDV